MGNLIWILTRWPESTETAIIRLCLCHTIFINFKVMYHKLKKCLNSRSSHQSCSIEKAVFKNFAIFTGKHLCWRLLLIDLWASSPATFFKRDSNAGVVNIVKFLRTLILTKICEQLLLQSILLIINISSWVLVSALNSIGLLQRSSSRFKEFSLGCLVVGSSLIWKKRKISRDGHSFSFVVTRCTTRLSFYKRSLREILGNVYIVIVC